MVDMILEIKILFFGVLFGFSSANVQIQPNDSSPCLGQLQEYQCTVSGTGGLTWRVRDSSDVAVGGVVSYNALGIGANNTVDQFSFEQLTTSPNIISKVSFTVQSSIDGYSIECISTSNSIIETIVIDIPGIPDSPNNVIIHTDTFTSTSVNISWTESSSSCVTVYRYNVSSVTMESIIMESTTSNNVLVEGLVPSDEEYCVIVTAVDYANRNSSGSDPPVCFIFDVPLNVSNVTVINGTESETTVEVIVEWSESPPFDVANTITIPDLLGYTVTIVNSTDPNDYSNTSGLLSSVNTDYMYVTDVPKGRTYNISVIAVNGVGNSEPFTEIFEAPGSFVDLNPSPPPSPSPSVTMTTMSSVTIGPETSTTITGTTSVTTDTSTTSATTTTSIAPTSESASMSIGPIVGGAVGGGGVFFVTIIILVIIIVLVFLKKKNSKSINLIADSEKSGGTAGKPMQLEDTSAPHIGQPLYQDVTDATNPPQAQTKPQQQPASATVATTELATYQDPNTIMRQQAPSTGDLYALPQRGMPKEEQPTGGQYAELDLPNKTDPSSQTPAVVQGTVQPVIYSDVRGQ